MAGNTVNMSTYKAKVLPNNSKAEGILYLANGTTYYIDASASANLLNVNVAASNGYKIDSKGAIWHNGTNLWIGATATNANVFTGKLYLNGGLTSEGKRNRVAYVSLGASDDATTGTNYPIVHKDAAGSATGPIYVDSNGKTVACTTYANAYVKGITPAGTSAQFWRGDNAWSNTISGGTITIIPAASTDAPSMAFNGGIQVREGGAVGNTQTALVYAPRISFHWGSITAKSISLGSDGTFYFRNQNGTDRSTIDANVVGNASTATKLKTARNLWGNSFNGTADIGGTIQLNNNCGINFKYNNTAYATVVHYANGNTGLNACGGGVYMGYTNTTLMNWLNGKMTLNSSGDLSISRYCTVNNRLYAKEWIQFDNWTGLYSPKNGAHFYPNNSSSYGTWSINGSRNGYYGINLGPGTGYMTLMCDGSGNGGLYPEPVSEPINPKRPPLL